MNRPKEFDARVVAYIPALVKRASRNGKCDMDLVQETVAVVLSKWENFREDGGFYNWLCWQMRGIQSDNLRRKKLDVSEDELDVFENSATTNERIHEDLEAKDILMNLNGRDGLALLRLGEGHTLEEVGNQIGTGCERARQITMRARAMLVKVAA